MLTGQEILDEYATGVYTRGETISRSIGTLAGSDQRDELWRSLPDWIRQEIDKILDGFSPRDELVTFGRGDPKGVHDDLVEMKRWRGPAQGE